MYAELIKGMGGGIWWKFHIARLYMCLYVICISIVILVIDYLVSLAGQIYFLAQHPPRSQMCQNGLFYISVSRCFCDV